MLSSSIAAARSRGGSLQVEKFQEQHQARAEAAATRVGERLAEHPQAPRLAAVAIKLAPQATEVLAEHPRAPQLTPIAINLVAPVIAKATYPLPPGAASEPRRVKRRTRPHDVLPAAAKTVSVVTMSKGVGAAAQLHFALRAEALDGGSGSSAMPHLATCGRAICRG
ncbi:hypothetical protein PLESTF_001201100 [Pleodorina starrii]|nr:hypothetical protein PLESTF_001201100 [Pleodorina starrii]